MLYTVAVILLALWLLGMAATLTMGGYIHYLAIAAMVVAMLRVFRVFQGPPPALTRFERRLKLVPSRPRTQYRRASDAELAA